MAEQKYTPGAAAHDLLKMLDQLRNYEHRDYWPERPPSRLEATQILCSLLHSLGHGAVVAIFDEVKMYLPLNTDRDMSHEAPWITPDTTAEIGCVNWGWMVNPTEVADV